MKRIRVGVVGAGFAGSTHIQALRRLPQVEVVALAGRSTDHARASATKLGVARSYGDYHEMPRDEPLDAVHICTPNQMHAEVTLAAIDARDSALSWNQERPNELWIGHRGGPDQVAPRHTSAMDPAASALSRQPAGHPEGWIDTFVNFFSDFHFWLPKDKKGSGRTCPTPEPQPTACAAIRQVPARPAPGRAAGRDARGASLRV